MDMTKIPPSLVTCHYGTVNPSIHPLSSPPVEEAVDSLHPMNTTFTFTDPREESNTDIMHEVTEETHQLREKSPKSVLREAKEKLKNKPRVKGVSNCAREKSPTGVLREARRRLRSLEVEADAARDAYQRYKGRRTTTDEHVSTLDIPRISNHKIEKNYRIEIDNVPNYNTTRDASTKQDFQKYLCEYQTKFNITSNKTSVQTTVIPDLYSKMNANEYQNRKENYLETPLTEFRKLYSLKSPVPSVPLLIPTESAQETSDSYSLRIKSKKEELEILKDNISKMYNLHDHIEIEKMEAVLKDDTHKETLREEYIAPMDEHTKENLTTTSDLRDIATPIEEMRKDNVRTDELTKETIALIEELSEKRIIDETRAENTPPKDEFIEEIPLAPAEIIEETTPIENIDPVNEQTEDNSTSLKEMENLVIFTKELADNVTGEVETLSESNILKVENNAKEESFLAEIKEVEKKAPSELEAPFESVSPKPELIAVNDKVKSVSSVSPLGDMLTRSDADSIFLNTNRPREDHANKNGESVPSGSENEYADEFSAVQSHSERSSISLPKHSDDDNFWD